MGEVIHIAERRKRSRFEAPVQVQEFFFYRPCAILLKTLRHLFATSKAGALR